MGSEEVLRSECRTDRMHRMPNGQTDSVWIWVSDKSFVFKRRNCWHRNGGLIRPAAGGWNAEGLATVLCHEEGERHRPLKSSPRWTWTRGGQREESRGSGGSDGRAAQRSSEDK